MATADVSETTQLLRAWAKGDREALEKLTPRVYDELRRIAGHFMRDEQPGRTMQTTALVHEAFLKLIDVENVDCSIVPTSSLSRRKSCGASC